MWDGLPAGVDLTYTVIMFSPPDRTWDKLDELMEIYVESATH